jgi:hypothetical protein
VARMTFFPDPQQGCSTWGREIDNGRDCGSHLSRFQHQAPVKKFQWDSSGDSIGLTRGRLVRRAWTSPLLKPQKRKPSTRGCQTNEVEGETSTNVWRGFQSNVENNVSEPSSYPLARIFPSGENSKAETDLFRSEMVVSSPYLHIDMGERTKIFWDSAWIECAWAGKCDECLQYTSTVGIGSPTLVWFPNGEVGWLLCTLKIWPKRWMESLARCQVDGEREPGYELDNRVQNYLAFTETL